MCSSCCCSPKHTARVLVRIGFGLGLLFMGIAQYRDPSGFAMSVSQGLGTPWLEQIGLAWGYILPLLFIVGGFCFVFRFLPKIGTWIVGIALISIPAGLLFASAVGSVSLNDSMPAATNALIWILVYLFASKAMKKHGCCGNGACPMCGMNPCMCGMKGKDVEQTVKSAVKNSMNASMSSMKDASTPAPKSAPKKKSPPKKSAM